MYYYILDKDKNPVQCDPQDIVRWGEWMVKSDNKIVAQTHIGDVMVSTVFLGIDHNWSFEGAPILFETMVFGGDKDLDSYQERYSTYKEAMEGHLEAILAVKRKITTII